MTFELFFTEPYFQRVLLTALVVAATSAAIGVFLVQRGMALFGDGVAHMSFAGIAIGFVAGWMPLVVALVVASIGALSVQELQRRKLAKSDAALGIVYTASLAIGVVLVSSRGAVPVDVESYLFGNLLLAGEQEFLLATVSAGIVGLALVFLWRPFLLLSFGEERAKVQGVPARLLNGIFTILTALTVVAAVRVVGVLLVAALLIMPASAANRLAGSTFQAVLLSMGFSTVAVLLGLAIGSEFALASGATIALVAASMFAATTLIRRA